MRTFLLGLIGLSVVGVVAIVGMHGVSQMTAINPTVSSVLVAEEAESYTIQVEYPQFGLESIDKQIRDEIETAVEELKSLPPNPPESAVPKVSLDGMFENVYIGPEIISAKLILSQYTGGAHQMTIISGINFDRMNGRRLLLDDVLPMIGKSVQELSQESTVQLRTKFGNDLFPEGADTNPENFSSFVIAADSVTFIFQPYQVAAYAAGPQEISFARVK